jgi:signal transduction histidine kinase
VLHFAENAPADLLLTPVQALNLYRIAQEGINNALKHAEAKHLTISLYANGGKALVLSIHDDGRFLNNGEAPSSLSGNGLRNMQRRAQELGGTVKFNPDEEQGTSLEVSVPM